MKKYLDLKKDTKIHWDPSNMERNFGEIISLIHSTNCSDFIVSTIDYIKLIHIFKSYNITSERTASDNPKFSFAGISFSMLSNEELEKYIILK